MNGITLDSVERLDDIVAMLKSLPMRIWVRIVFDEDVDPSEYEDACIQISQYANIQGEILDSYYLAEYSKKAYEKRADDYIKKLKPYVSIWEVVNEVNGEWCGRDALKKWALAQDVAKSYDVKTAATLYYNSPCVDDPSHEMWTWLGKNMLSLPHCDYVWLSFYEDDCTWKPIDWNPVFAKLGHMFPLAQLGFGECGTKVKAKKALLLNHYYRDISISHPQYVGGYFWWYGYQDFVPHTNPLFEVLRAALVSDRQSHVQRTLYRQLP